MERKRRTIGVDLGGTGISFIDMYSPREVIARSRIDTPKTREAIVSALIENLRGMAAKEGFPRPAGVGLAVAGQVGKKGIVFSPNLPFKTEFPLAAEIEKATGFAVTIGNDANAAAIGERIFGAAQGMDDFIVLTLGTGIGSGIFANGKLLAGHTGAGGEAGHIPLLPGGPVCGCGQRGCLEALASGTAISRAYFDKTGTRKTAKEVCSAAANGEGAAVDVLREAGQWLGAGLVALINLFNPQGLFFTGSLSNAPDAYFEPALKRAREGSFGTSGKEVVIEVSKLASDIGVIGAASLPLYS